MFFMDINCLTVIFISFFVGAFIAYFVLKSSNNKELLEFKQLLILEKHESEERCIYVDRQYKKLKFEMYRLKKNYLLKNERFGKLIVENFSLKKNDFIFGKLEFDLKNQIVRREKLIETNLRLEKKVSELNALLLSERKYSIDRKQMLASFKNNILEEFKMSVGNAFRDEGIRFSAYNKNQMVNVVTPLKEQLKDFKKKVEDVYDKESRDRSILLNEIYKLKTLNESISNDAINLTKALKGDIKIQGGWGEMILERVLELSGLQKGRSYDLQLQLKQSNGNYYRPDAIIHLPEGKDVVVDSKVSLKNYEQCCSSNDRLVREKALKNHVTSIKAHIKGLSSKSYEKLEGIRSLDFVLMFIPIEEAFFMAIKEEISILSDAFKSNVFVVCPSTLLITLRTIKHIWLSDDQKRNSVEIARQAGEMYDKFVTFLSSIEDIGKQLDKAKDSYHLAKKRLSEGKGNLVRRAKKLKALGLKTKKVILDTFENCE